MKTSSILLVALSLVSQAEAAYKSHTGGCIFGCRERQLEEEKKIQAAEFEKAMLRGLAVESGCHDCSCFTCSDVTPNMDGTLTATVKHCKGGTISWICCTAIDGVDTSSCDTTCSSGPKCSNVQTEGFKVTLPAGSTSFTVNTHDGKTKGDSNRVSPTCGGKAGMNTNQGSSCGTKDLAGPGVDTAHCLKTFDLENDCGFVPPPVEGCDDEDCIVNQGGLCDVNQANCVPRPPCFCELEGWELYDIFLDNGLIGPGSWPTYNECMCAGCDICGPELKGDPHLKTWDGNWFEYMGECDLKLLTAPLVDGKHDIEVVARTTIRDWYSYIEAAAVRIGDEVAEFDSYGNFVLNGVEGAAAPDAHVWHAPKDAILTMAGYPVYYQKNDKKHARLDIVLGPHQNITLKSFKDWVAVDIQPGTDVDYQLATGLMGTYDGRMLSRNGTDLHHDIEALANDWQVKEYEQSLFRAPREPQAPALCNMPQVTLESLSAV